MFFYSYYFFNLSVFFTLLAQNVTMSLCRFPPLTISQINCNSLNISSNTNAHHKLKIYGITKLKTDIILLSDIRLGHSAEKISELEKTFRTNPYGNYNFFYNSNSSSRGMGILIKNTVDFSVINEARDESGNILALLLDLKGTTTLTVSTYGPNKLDPHFFNTLGGIFSDMVNIPIIAGGDWNTTYSSLPVTSNPDVLNMNNVPNHTHSKLLSNLCERFNLTDPFRCFYPDRRDFSYVPRDPNLLNRSRLDFFLISKTLFCKAQDCFILPALQNKLFDHKATFITFNKDKAHNPRPCISNFILKDPYIGTVVNITARECYLFHSVVNNADALRDLGRACELLRRVSAYNPLPLAADLPAHQLEELHHDELQREGWVGEINDILMRISLEELQHSDLNILHDLFLE